MCSEADQQQLAQTGTSNEAQLRAIHALHVFKLERPPGQSTASGWGKALPPHGNQQWLKAATDFQQAGQCSRRSWCGAGSQGRLAWQPEQDWSCSTDCGGLWLVATRHKPPQQQHGRVTLHTPLPPHAAGTHALPLLSSAHPTNTTPHCPTHEHHTTHQPATSTRHPRHYAPSPSRMRFWPGSAASWLMAKSVSSMARPRPPHPVQPWYRFLALLAFILSENSAYPTWSPPGCLQGVRGRGCGWEQVEGVCGGQCGWGA